MDQAQEPLISIQLQQVTSLLDRIRGQQKLPGPEVERVLDRGLGRLLTLEARLRCPTDADSSSSPWLRSAEVSAEIAALRAALVELRAAAETERSSWAACGFVLPRHRARSGGRYSDGYQPQA